MAVCGGECRLAADVSDPVAGCSPTAAAGRHGAMQSRGAVLAEIRGHEYDGTPRPG
jgi:hypothetical protein